MRRCRNASRRVSEPARLARHLRDAYVKRGSLHVSAAEPKLWFLALNTLIARGALDEAAYAAARLQEAYPQVGMFLRSRSILERLPDAVDDIGFTRFVDRPDEDVQIVRRQGATTVLFAFTGRYGILGLPLSVIHRWFGQAGFHVVYLRDRRDTAFCGGIAPLGRDRSETAGALGRIADGLGAERRVCYGNSSGGFGALLYGLDLSASAVLAVGAATDMTAAAIDARVGNRIRVAPGPDLRALYLAAPRRPRVTLCYGEENAEDAHSARHLDGVPGVHLAGIPSYDGHDLVAELIRRGRFGCLLSDLAGASPPVDSQSDGCPA